MLAADTLECSKLEELPYHTAVYVWATNMFSEILFATMNILVGLDSCHYESVEAVSKALVQYNNEYHHRGINFVTPAESHAGRDHEVLAKRKATLALTKALHPNRWIKAHVMNCMPASAQYLTPAKRGATVLESNSLNEWLYGR